MPRVGRGLQREWRVGKVMRQLQQIGHVLLKNSAESCIGYVRDKHGQEMKCATEDWSP